MENLNAEKVKKALEIHTGILDKACEECPYNCDAHDEICLDVLAVDTLTLINSQEQRIKELTQANEMLSESYDHLEKTKDELLSERGRLTEENERLKLAPKIGSVSIYEALEIINRYCESYIKKAKADTVRKFAERLTKEFDRMHKNNFMTPEVRQWIINQIAKEMLEEDHPCQT